MAITQKITNFPTAPNSATDTPTEFNAKADAFVHHQSDSYVIEVNQWATEANLLKGEVNTIKTDIDNIVASIPSGSINDGSTATDKVWSSAKVSADIESLKNSSPEIQQNATWTTFKYPNGATVITSITGSVKGALPSSLNSWEYLEAGGIPAGALMDTKYTISVNQGNPQEQKAMIFSGLFFTTTSIKIGVMSLVSLATKAPFLNVTITGRWK